MHALIGGFIKKPEKPEEIGQITWESIYKLGIGSLNIHPWDLKRYTLRELFYRVEIRGRENKQQVDLITQQYRNSWNQVRWQTAQLANYLGGKLTSVFQLAVFEWDKPEAKPTEDLLKHFPKTLKNG